MFIEQNKIPLDKIQNQKKITDKKLIELETELLEVLPGLIKETKVNTEDHQVCPTNKQN